MGNLPGQKTGVLRGYLQISKRTHEKRKNFHASFFVQFDIIILVS